MASLGPWSLEEVVEYLDDEHPRLHPGATEQVSTFLASAEPIIELKVERVR